LSQSLTKYLGKKKNSGVAGVQELQNGSPEFRAPKDRCHYLARRFKT
jgi:hypothetical protein